MPSKNFTDELLISGREQGRLVERTLASGTKVHKSTAYLGKKGVLETWHGLTRTEAKRKHLDRVGKISKASALPERLTLGVIRDRCWAHHQKLIDSDGANGNKPPISQAVLGNRKTAWDLRVTPFQWKYKSIDSLLLGEFTKPVAREWLKFLTDTGVAPGTQVETLKAVRLVLNYARDEDLFGDRPDPFSGIPKAEIPKAVTREGWEAKIFTGEQLDEIIEAALSDEFEKQSLENVPKGHAPALLGNAVVDFIKTGARLSEVAGRRWSAIEGDVAWVREQRRKQKGAEAAETKETKSENGVRAILIKDVLAAAYDRQREHERSKDKACFPQDFIYTDLDGRPVSTWQLQRAVKRACRIAGFGSHGPQVLRRSLGTSLAYQGFKSPEIAQVLGNTVAVAEKNYIKKLTDVAEVRRLGERMAS